MADKRQVCQRSFGKVGGETGRWYNKQSVGERMANSGETGLPSDMLGFNSWL